MPSISSFTWGAGNSGFDFFNNAYNRYKFRFITLVTNLSSDPSSHRYTRCKEITIIQLKFINTFTSLKGMSYNMLYTMIYRNVSFVDGVTKLSFVPLKRKEAQKFLSLIR